MSCLSSFVCTQLDGFKYCYLTLVILFIKSSYLIHTSCPQLYGFKQLIIIIRKRLNSSVWPIDGALTDTPTLG